MMKYGYTYSPFPPSIFKVAFIKRQLLQGHMYCGFHTPFPNSVDLDISFEM